MYSPLMVSFYSNSRKEVDNWTEIYGIQRKKKVKSNWKKEKEQKKVDMERKEDNRTASVRQVVEK